MNPLEDLFGDLMGDKFKSVAGSPQARPCATKAELAAWFKAFAIACRQARGEPAK